MEQVKKFLPALFALLIFCFLLPFFTLSFNGQKVASMSGLQLVTQDNYRASDELRYNHLGHLTLEEQRIRAHGGAYGEGYETFGVDAFPILALLVAFLGLIISFIKMSKKSLLIMIVSISGAVIFYLLKNSLDKRILSFEKGRFFIEYEFGYWFALLIFIVLAVIHGIIYNQERKISSVQVEHPSSV